MVIDMELDTAQARGNIRIPVHGTRCFLNMVNEGTDIFIMIGVQPASTSFGRQPRLASKLDDLHFLKFLRKVTPL